MFEQLPSLRGFQPKFYSGSSIRFHLPLLYALVAETKPKRIVVIGIGEGDALFTFCQAATEEKIAAECIAVRRPRPGEPEAGDDSWKKARDYGEEFYGRQVRFAGALDLALTG